MNLRTAFVASVALLLGAVVGVSVSVLAQTGLPTVSELTLQKREPSKMDWALVNARISALEAALIEDSEIPITPADVAFDDDNKKIVASEFVRPQWLKKNSLDEVRDALNGHAVDVCATSVGIALMRSGMGPLSWKDSCTVRFYTWKIDKGELTTRDVASWENGNLILK